MHRIIPIYEGMARYVQAARAEPSADLQKLWDQYVVEPYWQDWAAGEFNEDLARQIISQPYQELDALDQRIGCLYNSAVQQVAADAYQRIASLLPYHEGSAAIGIIAANPQNQVQNEDKYGVVGTCIGANTLLSINPCVDGWQGWIGYVMAHERHHTAWGYYYYFIRHAGPPCLLVSLISEGGADMFAHQLYPDLQPAWVNALTSDEEFFQWQKMKDILLTPDPDRVLHQKFFFGDSEGGIPPFTGYTIGYHILQAYLLRHPGESVSQWTIKDPLEVLAESWYSS